MLLVTGCIDLAFNDFSLLDQSIHFFKLAEIDLEEFIKIIFCGGCHYFFEIVRQRVPGLHIKQNMAYNHIILPLANRRDRLTQIRWGIAEFQHRFGREPEALWLPETAANEEVLDELKGVVARLLQPEDYAVLREACPQQQPALSQSSSRP